MFARSRRTIFSFMVVLAAFAVYRVAAVPFLEPARQIKKRVAPVSPEQRLASRVAQNRLGGYARFFPEGSWERDNPIVLESETSKLLLKEYTTLPDGHLKLNPCTLIYLPEGDAEAADSHKRVIILQAPEGAELKFDQPVDLSRGKIGRLEGGVMSGSVIIQSGPTKPEGGDDFFAVTHDVQMQDNLIFTQAEVDFRFGQSQGHGRQMRIELLPGQSNGGSNHGTNYSGVQSLQLLTEVQMHLQPSSGSMVPGSRNAAAAPAVSPRTVTFSNGPGARTDAGNNPPIDISCQGIFEFDLVQNMATFHKHVDVVRPHPDGPSDQINGELLTVYFAPRDQQPAGSKGSGNGATAKAKPANSNATHGMPQLEPRRLVVRGNPVVARAESVGGEIRGDHLEYDILARHMTMEAADAKVQIESPQLSGEVARLEIWTRDAQPNEQLAPTAQNSNAGATNGRNGGQNSPQKQSQNNPRGHNEVYGGLLQVWSTSSPAGNQIDRITLDGNVRFKQSPSTPGEKPLETKGDFLEVLHANAPTAEVAISGQPAEVAAQGLTMFGQTVHLNRGENRLWIDGVGRMILTGEGPAPVNQATMPADPRAVADRNNMFSTGRGTTTVDWQRGMLFDGRTVKFDGSVVGQRVDGDTTQTIRAPQMDVILQQGVDFNAVGPEQRQRPQIEWLTCRGDVWLENRQTQQGQIVDLDRMEHLSTLTVNQITGDLTGQATPEQPGHVLSWRLGAPPSVANSLGGASATPPANSNRMQINYLDVQFQRGITGNVLAARQELTFQEQVRCLYGPVANWDMQLDADSPAGPPIGSMVLTCDQLTTTQTPARGQARSEMEMVAVNNVRVESQRLEGDSFSALSQRLTYSQAKDMLVLSGDGRTNAELYRQQQPGAPQTKTAAGTISYWPTTRKVQVGDLKFLDSTQFSNQTSPRAKGGLLNPSAAPNSSATGQPTTAQPAGTPPRR
jgi:lipopolysaccharide export system protein LptA